MENVKKVVPILRIYKSWGKALSPASVIKPDFIKRRARSRLDSDQLLLALLGVNRPANRSASKLFSIESIHPKQSASSTAYVYGIVDFPVDFL